MLAAEDSKTEQESWGDSDDYRTEQASGDTERTRQVGFADAKPDQGKELEGHAAAVQHDVQGDETFKAQAEAHGPSHGADEDGDPWGATAIEFAEGCGQHAILGHGERQAGVAHHQSVEHAKAADHASEDRATRSTGPATSPAMSAHEPVSHALARRPVIHMAATGTT